MSKINFEKRWENVEYSLKNSKNIFHFFKDKDTLNLVSPFGKTETGYEDFRGIKYDTYELHKLSFKNADLSFSNLNQKRLENSSFLNCIFEKADFSNSSDHGNKFINCKFIDCKFNKAILGYNGSLYSNCKFLSSNFLKTDFIRAEFNNCYFKNCKLKEIDFNNSSFENCSFEGKLDDIWFRGQDSSDYTISNFGKSKENKMLNVDFSKAELMDLTFSDNCDLSTITMPQTGHYILFDNWQKKLKILSNIIETWPIESQNKAKIFSATHTRFDDQNHNIINIDELKKEYGEDLANNIIIELNRY